jgi:hypothetical protein
VNKKRCRDDDAVTRQYVAVTNESEQNTQNRGRTKIRTKVTTDRGPNIPMERGYTSQEFQMLNTLTNNAIDAVSVIG